MSWIFFITSFGSVFVLSLLIYFLIIVTKMDGTSKLKRMGFGVKMSSDSTYYTVRSTNLIARVRDHDGRYSIRFRFPELGYIPQSYDRVFVVKELTRVGDILSHGTKINYFGKNRIRGLSSEEVVETLNELERDAKILSVEWRKIQEDIERSRSKITMVDFEPELESRTCVFCYDDVTEDIHTMECCSLLVHRGHLQIWLRENSGCPNCRSPVPALPRLETP